jgi:hypothetical protein
MASSPIFKVHAVNGEYIASCKLLHHAIVLTRLTGGKIRYGSHGPVVFSTDGYGGAYDIAHDKAVEKAAELSDSVGSN